MAPRKAVLSLADAAHASIGAYLNAVCRDLLDGSTSGVYQFLAVKTRVERYLYSRTPPQFHNRLALTCMESLDAFFKAEEEHCRKRLDKAAEITKQLSGVIASRRLEVLDRPLSKPVAESLLDHLPRLSGLTRLETSSFRAAVSDAAALKERLLTSPARSCLNLTTFSGTALCDDAVVAAICQNCAELRSVVVPSDDVTDTCVESLVGCRNLEDVDLRYSSVTSQGICRLLTESKSPALSLSCHDPRVLEHVNSQGRALARHLKSLHVNYEDSAQMGMIPRFFPRLQELTLGLDVTAPDLLPLASLQELRQLHLVDIDLPNDPQHGIARFFEIRGSNLTSLSFSCYFPDGVTSVYTFLERVGLTCPNLKNLQFLLSLEGHSPQDFGPLLEPQASQSEQFQKLEYLCVGDESWKFVSAVLSHAKNITCLALDDSNLLDLMEYIFRVNPLTQLQLLSLCGHRADNAPPISAGMIRNVIERCDSLKCIQFVDQEDSELIDNMKLFIQSNNYDVDILNNVVVEPPFL